MSGRTGKQNGHNSFSLPKETSAILFIGGIFFNFAVSILNGILGFVNQSAWQGALCAYYLGLLLIRLWILYDGLHTGSQGMRKSARYLRRIYLRTSILILFLDLILGGIVYLMVVDEGTKHYPGVLIYGVAAYAFAKLTMAIAGLVRASRERAPVLMAIRLVGYVDALVSILMLETALIDAFGDRSSEWARMMTALSGSGAWLLAAIAGIFGIRWSILKKR